MVEGITQLGYLVFEVGNIDAWRHFSTGVLGLTISRELEAGGFALRMDSRVQRFVVQQGPADDLAAVGWEVENKEALMRMADNLNAGGVSIEEGSSDLRLLRQVEGLITCSDPSGIPTEIFYGPKCDSTPFQSPLVSSGFVAEEQGLGHVVLGAQSKEDSTRFYTNILGFKLSDYIRCDLFGHDVDISFFHANPRHHSLALGAPMPKKIHHFMLQSGSIHDVGHALDRTLRSGLPLMQTLGRHPNDQMISFYAETPSAFQFEFGCGARTVDDATWSPTTYDHVSEWGHHHPALLKPGRLRDMEKKP